MSSGRKGNRLFIEKEAVSKRGKVSEDLQPID